MDMTAGSLFMAGSIGLNSTRQETFMTVLLSCITAADQLDQLACINDSRLQVDSDHFKRAIK